MKKHFNTSLSLLLLSIFTLASCSEDTPDLNTPEPNNGSINLLAAKVGTANTEITNINLENGEQFSFVTECMVLSSRVYDATTETIGYTSCDNTFVMVNPTTGEQLNAYPLPGAVNMAVVNDAEHLLIGTYYNQTEEMNHVIRLDLDNGELLSDITVDNLGPMYTCTQFFNQGNQTFSLIRSDDRIVTIDAASGQIVSEVGVNAGTNIIYFREEFNTLISITYDQASETNFVEQTNVATGELLKRTALQRPSNFRLCAISFDSSRNSLVTINSDNQVRYINIDNGEVVDDIDLDPEKIPLTFYAQ